MCGIAGILRVTPPGSDGGASGGAAWEGVAGIPESWLDTLDAAIAHRGPDGSGRFRDSAVRADGAMVEVALVHRRLSIIDIEGGAQPMVSIAENPVHPYNQKDGVKARDLVAVVFNGCIYNHRRLRGRLEKFGHLFASDHSDTEVLIAGYRQWHAGVIEELDGMFAAAIWDARAAILTLYRDRFGEKPLFWWVSRDKRTRAFASVPGVLARLRDHVEVGSGSFGVQDGQSAGVGFAHGFSEATPPFAMLERVRPGEPVMLYPVGGWPDDLARPQAFAMPKANAPGIESLEQLESFLDHAVRSRLEADVPVGCFLSGGIDSSLVAMFMSRHHRGVRGVTVKMPDPRYDESEFAAVVARHLGIELEIVPCDGLHAADDVVTLIGNMQTPFGDSSLLPAYWMCKSARRSMKVALSGDGGDELFFGYDRYRAVGVLKRWGSILKHMPLALCSTADPKSRSARLARLADAARGEGWTELGTIFGPSDRRRLLKNKRFWDIATPWIAGTSDEEWARRVDVVKYLPGDLLRKVDTAALSAGLEVRCPFLEPELSALALATPFAVHTRGGVGKALLRELAARHLPAEIVNRPKQGFAVPIGEWFRSDFGGLRTLLMDVLGSREPFGVAGDVLGVDMGAVRGMVDEHMSGGRDHGQRLYALMVLGVWARGLESGKTAKPQRST